MGTQDDDRKYEALAKTIVEGYPEHKIRDVVEIARKMDVSTYEKYEAMFNSGLFEGARLAYVKNDESEREILDVLRSTLTRIDDAMSNADAEAMLQLKKVREPIVWFFNAQAEHARAIMVRLLCRVFHFPTEQILLGNTPIDQIAPIIVREIGFDNLHATPTLFIAFLVVGSTPMPCKCPAHLLEALSELKLSEEEAHQRAQTRYPDGNIAIYEFGKYLITHARKTIAQGDAHEGSVEAMSPAEASKIAQEFLSRFVSKPNGG